MFIAMLTKFRLISHQLQINQKVLSTILASKRAGKDMVSRRLLYFIGLKKAQSKCTDKRWCLRELCPELGTVK